MNCFIIAALSADGFLADKTDTNSTSWTSPEDRHFFAAKTKAAGTIVMGRATYQTIGRVLPGRLNLVYTRHPETIPDSIPFTTDTKNIDNTKLYTTELPPADLIKLLESKAYTQLAICGGASIYTLFLDSGVVNTFYLTYEPIIFGEGIPLFTKPLPTKLNLINTTPLSPQTILLEYQVNKT